ncbi:MAG TPA: hypothetical protein VHY21_14895 [Pseudonocardiaceae bacterium]|jgi:hypothetical protein|nr:hypothetical protein [Pseudonocardiaceae bacterium]
MTSRPADPPDQPRGRARPPATRTPAFPRPTDVVRELVTLLRTHGLQRLYWSGCALIAVISITNGLTVWTDGRYLTWTSHGTRTTLPAHDTHTAAEHLAHLACQPPGGTTP